VSNFTTEAYIEVPIMVEVDYQPYEPPERGPEAQYPGCAESLIVERVWLNGDPTQDITHWLTDEQRAALAARLLEEQE
jgi:hypothetical protein